MDIIKKGFTNERLGIELDVYVIDGREWFKDSDLANFLRYRDSYNMKRSIDFLHENSIPRITRNGYEAHYLNEIALYECVLKIRDSKTDEIKHERFKKAREFQKWVFSEILPSIRKNNYYIDEKNITDKQKDELIKRLQGIVTNGSNIYLNNSKRRLVVKELLENMFPDISDIYQQFLDKMMESGVIDSDLNTTQKFIDLNKSKDLYIYDKRIRTDVDITFIATNKGIDHLVKTLVVENGKLKSLPFECDSDAK